MMHGICTFAELALAAQFNACVCSLLLDCLGSLLPDWFCSFVIVWGCGCNNVTEFGVCV